MCVLIDLFLVQIFVLSCKTKEKDAIFRFLALDDSNVINMHKVSAKKYPKIYKPMPDNINFLNNKKYQFFSLGILVFYQYLKMSDINFINVN